MKCPSCPRTLVPVGTQGQAHACPEKHGLLLSEAEIRNVFDGPDAETLLRAHLGSATPGEPCPACFAVTRRARTYRPAKVEIEACPTCKAIWFVGEAGPNLAPGGVKVSLGLTAPIEEFLRRIR